MKKLLPRLLYGFLAVASIVVNFMVSGLTIASVHVLGWLGYPAFFGFGMLLCGLVFCVLLPAHRKRIVSIPFIEKFLTVDDKRFAKGPWPWIRKRGPFALTLAASLLIGPFFAAMVIRFLGLNEHKAWVYAFFTTFVSTVVWVSIYLGALDLIKSALASTVS